MEEDHRQEPRVDVFSKFISCNINTYIADICYRTMKRLNYKIEYLSNILAALNIRLGEIYVGDYRRDRHPTNQLAS
jgi:hypothetical protein